MDIRTLTPRTLLLSTLMASAAAPGCSSSTTYIDAAVPEDSAVPADTAVLPDSARPDSATDPGRTFTPCGVAGFPLIVRAVPSPDGSVIALATRGRQVVLVDAQDGGVRVRIDAHEGALLDVAFARGGQTIYTMGDDGYVRAWRASDGLLLWSSQRRLRASYARLAAHGNLVVAGGRDVEGLDAETGATRFVFPTGGFQPSGSLAVAAVAITPDGSTIAVSLGASVALLDRGGRPLGRTFSADLGVVGSGAYTPEVASVQFSPDGSALLLGVRRAYFSAQTGVRFPVARVFSVADGATIATLTAGSPYGVSASFSHDGSRVAVAGGGMVEWWSVRDASRWLETPEGPHHALPAQGEAILDPRDRVVMNGGSLALFVADEHLTREPLIVPAGDPSGRTLAFTTEGRTLLRSTARNDRLELWSVTTGLMGPRTIASERGEADIAPDGTTIALARSQGVELRAIETGGTNGVLAVDEGSVRAVAFAPDGRSVLVASAPSRSGGVSTLSQWWLSGNPVARRESIGSVGSLRRARSGDAWIAVGPSRSVYRGPMGAEVFAADGALTQRFAAAIEGAGADSADVSPDGATLLMAPWVMPLRMVRLADGSDVTLASNVRTARVAYSPDGALVVRGSIRGSLVVADAARVEAGEEITPRCSGTGCVGPAGDVERVAFSADGRVLAVGTSTGDTRVYCRVQR